MAFTRFAFPGSWTSRRLWIVALSLLAIGAAGSDARAQAVVRDLTITVAGTGSGTVTTVPGGISCPGDCVETYGIATQVTLTFSPAAGSTFTSATGSCTAVGPSTTPVTDGFGMAQTRACTVTFTAIQHSLSVTLAGSGSGAVTSAPAGINCSAGTCAANFNQSASVTLTATPSAGSTFTGWSGACSGVGAASMTISAATACTATFTSGAQTLSVTLAGTGAGTVTSSPSGISCAAGTCTAGFSQGTVVTLAATPASGSTFAGWSGACSGSGTAAVTLSSSQSCTASFTAQTKTLTIGITGPGTGTVTSSPAGLACSPSSGTCSASFPTGTVVALSSTAAAGSAFTLWSGCAFSTSPSLTLTIAADVTCVANLTIARTLTLRLGGDGRGTVTSTPAGLACTGAQGTLCTATFNQGTSVALAVVPASGSEFAGWSGTCAATALRSITIDMAADADCTATFKPGPVTPASGWWWNADEAGRGYSFEISAASGQAFFGAYMYDEGGNSSWYVSAMTASGDGRSFTGGLLRFQGGQTQFGSYTPPEGHVVGVESTEMRVEFTSDTSGVITFPAPDRAKSETRIPISRFPFVGDGLTNPMPAGALPETGWWWNPAESGRGMFIEVQADTQGNLALYSAIYGYESSGNPSWHVATSTLVSNAGGWAALSMPLQQCRNGQVLGATGAKTAICAPASGGTTTIQFTADGTTALITLANGSQIPIRRYRF